MRSRWEISYAVFCLKKKSKSKFQIRNLHETARSLRGATISPGLFVLHRRLRLDLVHLRRKRQHLDLSRPAHLPDVDRAILSYPGPADPRYSAPGRPAPGAPLQPGPDVALERNRFDAHRRGKLASAASSQRTWRERDARPGSAAHRSRTPTPSRLRLHHR